MIVSLLNGGYGYSDYGMFNSIWICIGPTSRLHFTIILSESFSLAVCQHTCVHAYACVRAIIACGSIPDCPQNVWVCYNFIGVISWVSVF